MRDAELAALLRGARRLRAPHGQRQRLLRGRRAGDHPEHLRVPHQVAGLERHRLQLPRRPLRPRLGGPVRRRRPAGRRRAHARLQRLLLRHVGDRQLRARAAAATRCCRPTAPSSPGSCRCTASAPPRPRRRSARRPSRPSTATATPPRRPARASTSTPSSRRSGRTPPPGQVGWAGRELESNLVGSPHPDLVVRRASDKRIFVIPTQGSGAPLGEKVDTGWMLADAKTAAQRRRLGPRRLRRLHDQQRRPKALYLFRGNGQGGFAGPYRSPPAWAASGCSRPSAT